MVVRDLDCMNEACIEDFQETILPYKFEAWPEEKYLICSAMQKAIRRGDAETAVNAAANLYRIDKRMLQRRLLVTAYEDVGIGNIRAVCHATLICTDVSFRRRVSELRAYIFAAYILANATKCRAADHVYMVSNNDPELEDVRDALHECNVNALTKCALDNNASIHIRAYALQRIKRHSIDDAANVLEQSVVSPVIIDSCIVASSKTSDPLALYLPMILGEYYNEAKPLRFETSPALKCKHVPLYAADPLHTRIGKEALKRWKQQITALQGYTLKQLGKAVFHTESTRCNEELHSDALLALKCNGMRVSLLAGGLPEYDQAELFIRVEKNMDVLNDIRVELFETTLPPAQPSFI